MKELRCWKVAYDLHQAAAHDVGRRRDSLVDDLELSSPISFEVLSSLVPPPVSQNQRYACMSCLRVPYCSLSMCDCSPATRTLTTAPPSHPTPLTPFRVRPR